VWQIGMKKPLLRSFDIRAAVHHLQSLASLRGPDALREFLRSNVPSYEELDLLLLMGRESTRTWSPAEAGAALALSTDTALTALKRLCKNGILKSRARRGVVRFRFAPKTDELRAQIVRLARSYAVDRAVIAEMMSMNSLERLRATAAETFASMLAMGTDKQRRA